MANGKKAGTEVELATSSQFAILEDSAAVVELYQENMGDEQINEFGLDRAKIPSGGATTWAIPSLDGEEETKEIVGIPLHWKTTRAYWAEAYSGGMTPPDCSSFDGKIGHGEFGVNSEKHPSGLCGDCPMSQFGTKIGPTGDLTDAPACQLRRPVFIARPDELVPIVISLPPTSAGVWSAFSQRLLSKGKPFFSVVASFSLERVSNKGGIDYAKVVIRRVANLDDGGIAAIRKLREQLVPAFDTAAKADSQTQQAE